MDAVLLLSGFSGLAAAFVASAFWATRPTVIPGTRVVEPTNPRTGHPR